MHRGCIKIHSVRWDKVSVQSWREIRIGSVCECLLYEHTCLSAHSRIRSRENVLFKRLLQSEREYDQAKRKWRGKSEVSGRKLSLGLFCESRLHLFFSHRGYITVYSTETAPSQAESKALHTDTHILYVLSEEEVNIYFIFAVPLNMFPLIIYIIFALTRHEKHTINSQVSNNKYVMCSVTFQIDLSFKHHTKKKNLLRFRRRS